MVLTELIMSEIIKSQCKCGELINIEINAENSFRADLKRPHYEGDHPNSTQLRCRKCRGWLAATCKDAAHD